MQWVYRVLMAASIVGGAVVTGGLLPIAFAPVFVSSGIAAALFHDKPGAATVA
jgi:hypothetical protein